MRHTLSFSVYFKVCVRFSVATLVFEGDIIMHKIGDPGTSFLVDDRGKKMSLAMNLFLLRTSSLIDSKYAFLYLLADYKYVKSFLITYETQPYFSCPNIQASD